MNEMIERVAKALEDAAPNHMERHDTLVMARAAIEAMRMPTWEMQVAGARREFTNALSSETDMWFAMVDAALKK